MELEKRVAFLRRIHLFHDLKDDELTQVAERFVEVPYEAGAVILEQGAEADSFYIIYSGQVRVFRRREGREQELARLVPGDYFGEMELFEQRQRSASITALESTVLLRILRKDFGELIHHFPAIKPNIEVSIQSRKLARRSSFRWLQQGEVIYFLARKHPIFLLRALLGPVLSLLLPAFLFLWAAFTNVISPVIFGGILFFVILAWGIWNVIDWGNDYYIVTNRRVIWMEKVIFLYDSRQEAPLQTILSVGVETDVAGRIFDYGNVIVRTFVGAIPFRSVNHPYQAAHMVEEYWQRTKAGSTVAEKEAFKDALRQKLGLETPQKPPEEKKEEKKAFPRLYRPSLARILGTRLFQMRFEDGSTITYRKHWFVLFQQIGLPSIILFVLILFLAYRLYILAVTPDMALVQLLETGARKWDTIAVSLPLLMVPVFLWWVYQYIDWANDIFRVTSDQIMDIDRTPLGTEERRAAPLDNILSTEYTREGFLGYLFNFGTVFITVGGSQLAFEDVMDPAAVQGDIDSRRMARIAAKREADHADERNRMADWMAAYHQNVDEFRREQQMGDSFSKNE